MEGKEQTQLLKDLDRRIRRMESALLGDDDFGSKGFVDRYIKTERLAGKNANKLDRIYWVASLVGSGSALVFQGILTIFL
jgi:CRISPR/Cas system CSM-associated protein Csm3 (group 7 of RAMP superfamily)